MVFYLFNFSCPTKTKSFGMRAYIHTMVRNKIRAYISCKYIFIYLLINIWHSHAEFSHECAN